MPQISLYIDPVNFKKMEKAATLAGQSLSKWVKLRILESFDNDWPEKYFDLFGSVRDETFLPVSRVDSEFAKDVKRESL